MKTKQVIDNFDFDVLNNIEIADVLNLEDIQNIQDSFADASGVASIITLPDGTPITKPSNFCRLCKNIFQKTKTGCTECYHIGDITGLYNPLSQQIQKCPQGGLWNVGVKISVGNKHIANWIIGQILDENLDKSSKLKKADEIGIEREVFLEVLNEVPLMSEVQFNKVAKLLFSFANQLSEKTFYNLLFKTQIKERNKATVLLKKSEDTYRNLVENINDVIYEINNQGIIIYVSPAIERMVGYKTEELIGKSIFSFIYEADRKSIIERLSTLEKREYSFLEYRFIKKSGQIGWVRSSTTAIIENGKMVGGTGSLSDITERKLAEEALLKSEERLNYAQKMAKMGSWELNLITNEINWSENYYSLLELQPDSKEITNDYFVKMIHPEDLHLTDEMLQNANKNRSASSADFRIIMPNGQIKWIQDNVVPVYEGDTLIALRGVIIDITNQKKTEKEINDLNVYLELKIIERTKQVADTNLSLLKEIEERTHVEKALSESEKSYRTVVENVKEIIFQTNTEGHWLFLNNSWEEVTGYSVKESLGHLFYNWVHPEDRQRNADLFKPLIMREKDYCIHKVRYLTKDGGFRWIEVYARLGLNDKDEIIGTYGTLRDITESKKADEELQKARLEAERANLAKSEFLSRMSHELRTPLNSILGFAQLLEMGELIPGQQKSLDRILHSGKHLLSLINEVLDISRIEAGYIALSVEPVQLSTIIQEMIDIVQLLAEKRRITIKFIIGTTNHLFVKSDRQRLKQILLNLLNNSIKYNTLGGSVIIKTEMMGINKYGINPIRISISDTGLGISPENISKLFIPFERIGAEITEIEGSGLGLAVVKKLMDAMGGDFGVTSTLGAGSTFWIELPISESQLELIDKTTSFKGFENILTNKKGTILYIEDNASNIELVEQILISQRSGIRMITNINGRQAINSAIEYAPDLILLDLNLPDIHGSEVIKLLQAEVKTKAIPVVIISADGMQKQYQKLLTAGAKYYLSKPLDILKLLNVIDEFMV
jgi:PAS domain S-box-containing protein